MTAYESIREAIPTLARCEQAEDGAWVVTDCFYPSNSLVRVRVRGRAAEFVVSDEGGAVDEVTSLGLAFPDAERRIRRIARRQGLKVANGVIYSPAVNAEGLHAAIILVANVSKEAAHWGVEHMGFPALRNFREELTRLIDGLVGHEVQHGAPLVGASNKSHRFEHVISCNSSQTAA